MTEGRPPARPVHETTAILTVAMLAAAAIVAGALGFQMAAGRDPALGPARPQAQPTVVIRKTVVRRVAPGADPAPTQEAPPAPPPAPAPVLTGAS
jgi:hypothetical protein